MIPHRVVVPEGLALRTYPGVPGNSPAGFDGGEVIGVLPLGGRALVAPETSCALLTPDGEIQSWAQAQVPEGATGWLLVASKREGAPGWTPTVTPE